ncbi:MAG: HNH endonuclease [Ruminococcus flavefaciens]|nr:HNH endonuclease [Ruminococcus flavefaciens]
MAEILELSIGSLVLRMRNFQFLDPRVTGEGKKGMSHVAKMDKEIFAEFQNDWGELATMAEEIVGLALFDGTPEQGAKPLSSLTDRNKVSRERHFFRASVLTSYEQKCCITGLTLPTLLRASHIKPFNECRGSSERTDPHNGLLLNVLHDWAFDQGLITVTKDYRIWVSQTVKDYANDAFTIASLVNLEGTKIVLPRDFVPAPDCLEYHNDNIFKG